MTARVENYRWSASEFVRAWEVGAFDHRVALPFVGADLAVDDLLGPARP